ncbi:hypothetical protein D3P96_00635 [Weissella viridescens]|uniref:Uncharacterized protein n=1 Tax=Weissella viridescens TaxID=1629 RepID=A0A3P2RD51_WEIVI|nr:hypothetical protein [Weissella viridescens]RRG18524.1 hypothetical protein D3P96_00635 [Weissella viridescens]
MVTENQNTHNGKIESYQTSLKRKQVPEKIESYDTQLQRPTVENTVVDMDELEMMLNAPDCTMYNPRFTRMLSNLKVYMPCKNNGY